MPRRWQRRGARSTGNLSSMRQKRLVSVRLARERQLLHPLTLRSSEQQRYCNFQTARGLPKVLILTAPGHQVPYQADRPRHARDIRGRVGLALDCRFGPGPRTVRCKARSSSELQGVTPWLIWIKAVSIEDGNCETMTTRIQPSV